jgi:hypothetical protein
MSAPVERSPPRDGCSTPGCHHAVNDFISSLSEVKACGTPINQSDP